MRNITKLALGLAVVLIIMAVTKPDEKSFERYLEKKYDVETTEDDNDVEVLLNKVLKSGVNMQANVTKIYVDKTFYADVTTKEMLEEERYIGIFGLWINVGK